MGVTAFSEHETLEFLLGDRAELAGELLEGYTTLADALDDYRLDRLDPSTRGMIMVTRDLATSRLKRKQGHWRRKIKSAADAGEFFLAWFKGMDREEMAALYLNSDLRIIDCEVEASGDRYSVALKPEEMLRRATVLEARYIIVAHNHPDAFALPSLDDIQGTTMVSWSARTAGFELLDHIVVYHDDFISFYESGLISSDSRISDAEIVVRNGHLELKLGGNSGVPEHRRNGVYRV